MTSDEEKRRKELERKSSPSSPDSLRGKDEIQKLQREIALSRETGEKAELKRRVLQQQIAADAAQSAPTKEQRQNVASAAEKTATANSKEFAERMGKREEARKAAVDLGPEQEGESTV